MSIAEPVVTQADDPSRWSRVTVATKYPTSQRHLRRARRAGGNRASERRDGTGTLDGAVAADRRSGADRMNLKADGLHETEVIAHVTSRLVVNRTALKTRPEAIGAWIARFRAALAERDAR